MNPLLPCVSLELSLIFGWSLLLVCSSHWDYFFLGFPPLALPCWVLFVSMPRGMGFQLPACSTYTRLWILESILDTDGSWLISMVTPFMALLLTYPTTYLTSYLPCKFSSVQSLTCVQLFATPRTAARQASLSIINSQSLLKLMPIESVMQSNHLILCCPCSSCLQSFPASGSFLMSQFFLSGGQSIGVSA